MEKKLQQYQASIYIFQGTNSHGQLGQNCISEQCDLPALSTQTWSGKIKQIACGGGHTLLLIEDGKLFGCGWNHNKQLGFEGPEVCTFTRLWEMSGINFTKISCGWDSSGGISDNNVLHIWGSNVYGQLGLPVENYPKSVKNIQLELKVQDLSMGMRHSALVDVNGYVWVSGCGKRGQLGLGKDVTSLDRFQKIDSLNEIEKVVCGQRHTMALKKDGSVYSWGDNVRGQLGVSEGDNEVFVPLLATAIKKYFGMIREVFAGWTNGAALLDNGEAVFWGRNDYGQLGCEDSDIRLNVVSFAGLRIDQLALGSEHSVCLLEDNSVRAWGWNEHSNTGTGKTGDVKTPSIVEIHLGKAPNVYSGAGHSFIASEMEQPSDETTNNS